MNAQAQTKDIAITVIYSPDYRVVRGWRSGGTFTGIGVGSPVNSERVIITALEALASQSVGVLEHQETAAQSTIHK